MTRETPARPLWKHCNSALSQAPGNIDSCGTKHEELHNGTVIIYFGLESWRNNSWMRVAADGQRSFRKNRLDRVSRGSASCRGCRELYFGPGSGQGQKVSGAISHQRRAEDLQVCFSMKDCMVWHKPDVCWNVLKTISCHKWLMSHLGEMFCWVCCLQTRKNWCRIWQSSTFTCSSHDPVEFKILQEVARSNIIRALAFRRAEFSLFRDPAGVIPKGTRVQKGPGELLVLRGQPPQSTRVVDVIKYLDFGHGCPTFRLAWPAFSE